MIHNDTLLQNAADIITKCYSYFIEKCDRSLLQNASGFLLQNATVYFKNETVITNCNSTINAKNIKNRRLSRKGPHLNDSGSKLLDRNFLEKIKLFWADERCSNIIKDNELEYLLKDDCYDNPSDKTGHKVKHIEKDKGFGDILNDVREKNINRPIIGQLNINSISNKFHFLESEASKRLEHITDIWDKNWWVISLGIIFARWTL